MPSWLTLPDVSPPEGPVPPHVVLVGLPGAGKSTVAKELGRVLRRPVLDFDREIERRAGTTIVDLFSMHGEPVFRRLERELTAEAAEWRGGLVVDPGGGWITNEGALEMLRPPARLVWLKVQPAEAIRRLGSAVATRPLLRHPKPQVVLESLLKERESRYGLADFSINTQMAPLPAVVERIVAAATKWKPLGD